MDHHQQRSQPSSSSTKVERRIIEKNRRNHMKNLCSQLNSLLPNCNPKEALPLTDQIDEAIKYIRSLETGLKMAQEKKEALMGTKRSRSCGFGFKGKLGSPNPKSIWPQIEIHETGSSLEIILTCGLDNQFIFYEIIRILHEENIEVISAHSSLSGDSMLHVVHAEIRQSLFQFGATKVSERLKRFVNGSTSDLETHPELWDSEIGTDKWPGF